LCRLQLDSSDRCVLQRCIFCFGSGPKQFKTEFFPFTEQIEILQGVSNTSHVHVRALLYMCMWWGYTTKMNIRQKVAFHISSQISLTYVGNINHSLQGHHEHHYSNNRQGHYGHHRHYSINPLTHLGGAIGPSLFERPAAQKVMKLTKFGKINYSTEIVLAMKLSSGVSSLKAVLYE
jgi:hypothetical protein